MRKQVQKECIEAGEVTLHSSANICSFEVVVWRRLMRMVMLMESIGSGERAIIWLHVGLVIGELSGPVV